jgi:hypothetical protein
MLLPLATSCSRLQSLYSIIIQCLQHCCQQQWEQQPAVLPPVQARQRQQLRCNTCTGRQHMQPLLGPCTEVAWRNKNLAAVSVACSSGVAAIMHCVRAEAWCDVSSCEQYLVRWCCRSCGMMTSSPCLRATATCSGLSGLAGRRWG